MDRYEPVTTLEEERVRWAAVQRQVQRMDEPAICERSLSDILAILRFWRRYQQYVEAHRRDYELWRYRGLRRHLKRMIRNLKRLRHEHLVMQELNLQLASMAAAAEEPPDGV